MAGLDYGRDFGPLPGFTDSSYDNDPNMPGASDAAAVSGANSGPSTGAVIRVAWLIIILSLAGLWVMGALVFRGGRS